jgi:3-oxoacyl-[acyl-carrier-protein] synthase II
MGIISPIGTGKKEYFNSLIAGRNGIGRVTLFDATEFPAKVAGEVKGFNAKDFMESKKARRVGRTTQFAIAAARMALDDSNLKIDQSNSERVGISIGVGGNQMDIMESGFAAFSGRKRLSPFSLESAFPNASAGQISIELNICGPMVTFSTACAAGGNAVGFAIGEIQHDGVDAMVVGGAEAAITPLSFASFCAGHLLSTNKDPELASRPFDKHRDGLVMAEGAAFVVLESMEHAIKRGARMYCEVIGYASVSSAFDMTHPVNSGDNFKRAMMKALKSSDISPNEINYVNAHGVSAPLTDRCEAKAIQELFGEHTSKIAVSSIKSMIGQPFSASFPMQIVACLLTFERRIIPPTIHFNAPDDENKLSIVANNALGWENLGSIMVNSFGYGGTNVSLVLKPVTGQTDRRLRYAPVDHDERRKAERRTHGRSTTKSGPNHPGPDIL